MSNQQFDPEMRGVVFPNDKAGNERREQQRPERVTAASSQGGAEADDDRGA